MIFYFVRHGQTDFNKAHRIQGIKFDEPLNEQGVEDMHDLLPKLPKDFEVIFSSPHKRVLKSAEIIKEYSHKQILIRNEIMERDFGSLAGKTWKEIPDGEILKEKDGNQTYDYRPYGGESVEDMKKKVHKFVEEVKKMSYDKVLVVTSLGVLRLMYLLYKNELVIKIDNGTIHTFEI